MKNIYPILFKYLDVNGAKAMLSNSNIQFTNATKLNDPFDCHPGLVSNSNDLRNISFESFSVLMKAGARIGEFGYFPSENRDYTYVCCLSKNFDSILMWSYYTKNHQGICIGLNRYNINKYVPHIDFDVQYPDNLTKYNWAMGNSMEAFKHQLATKAPEWKHENEVRLLDMPPIGHFDIGFHPEILLYNDSHHQYKIGGECFSAIYLGVNISGKDKEEIIKTGQKLNPNIRIYQMNVNPNAFKLDFCEII